jgi:ABC-2 type transport system ATP-binding protein
MSVGAILEHLGRFFRSDTAARRRVLAEMIGLDLSRRAEDLSIGNKKTVALVAAPQHAPAVLVLDERFVPGA